MGGSRGSKDGKDQMKSFFNNKGATLVETMVGFGILGTVTLVVTSGIDFIDDKKKAQKESYAGEIIISSLVETIRSNIYREKIDPVPEVFLANRSVEDVKKQLNLCWTNAGYYPRGNQNCPGRMGYTISTLGTGATVFRGLYKVTVRVTHDTLFPKRIKQYEFVVRDP